jgi:hypothetical protein
LLSVEKINGRMKEKKGKYEKNEYLLNSLFVEQIDSGSKKQRKNKYYLLSVG